MIDIFFQIIVDYFNQLVAQATTIDVVNYQYADLFGIGTLITGILNFLGSIATDATNAAMTAETNASNERNVNATNASNERNVAATNASNERNVNATNAANLQIQREVNATNERNTAATNAMNYQIASEANELQKQMADVAYQRSTASNQISELIRAGYSEQQARMLVAGSLSPATYTPFAPAISEMQTPLSEAATMQAPQSQAFQGTAFQGVAPHLQGAQLGVDLYSSSYAAADGGILGSMLAENPTSIISEHLHEMSPMDYSSPADFQRYAFADDAPDWAKDLVTSKSWQNMYRSILGQKAYRSWLRSNSQFSDWKKEYEFKTIQNRISSINEQIAGINLEAAGVSLELDKLNLEMGNINLHYLPFEKENLLQIQNNSVSMSNLDLDAKERLHESQISSELSLMANNVTLSNLDVDQRQFLHEMTKGSNLAALKKQLLHDELDSRVYESSEYKDAYIKRVLQDEYAAGAIGLYKQYESQGMLNVLESDPNLNNIYLIGKALNAAGISDVDLARGIMGLDYSVGRDNLGYGLLFGYLSATGTIKSFLNLR